MTLKIEGLRAEVEGNEILKGVDLEARHGEVTAIMGPNGSGKSTLAKVVMGHPDFEVTGGSVTYEGEDVLGMEPDERARLGLFLSFQYPKEIPGVTMSNFLRTALNARREEDVSIIDFKKLLQEKMELLGMDGKFSNRYLNQGFSGGEKKRAEILQMAVLQPTMAILDETDSGLDIDALKVVADGINKQLEERKDEIGILLITHYQRMLNYVNPDAVHVMIDGTIAESGGPELAEKLEADGYEWIKE